MEKYLYRDSSHSTFVGIPMRQDPIELIVWEYVLWKIGIVERIIELGYLQGGLSLYLWMQAKRMDAAFKTYDIHNMPRILETGLANVIPASVFVRGDIFGERHDEIKKLIQEEGRTILACDDGDKPREFKMFGEYLKKLDVIAVHDFGEEIYADDIDTDRYKMIFVDITEEMHSKWRFFTLRG